MNTVSLPLLSQVRIASPCPAKWEDMTGDEVTRHCAQCDLDVHNLSAMTGEEAEAFLRAKVGERRTCARVYRREDGTIITRDCPVGLALWRRRAAWAAGRVAAAVLFLATGGWAFSGERREGAGERLRLVQPFRTVCEWLNPRAPGPVPVPPPPSGTFSVTMGAVSPFSTATLAPLKARKIAEQFARIKLLREAQDYDGALNLVDQVLLIDPNDDEALRLRDILRDEARDRVVATEPRKGTP